MSHHIVVERCGAVSPAGWGLGALLEIADANRPLPSSPLTRPGWDTPLQAHPVPPPASRLPIFAHARLRRTSPVSQYAVAAALEALGPDQAAVAAGQIRLGVICCVMSGCVNYSRRFYDEVLKDPSTASPLIFPETVFNAPSSHLASVLGATGLNYTVVGDPGTLVQALALAANWLDDNQCDTCLVVGAEELDWLTADAFRYFSRNWRLAAGAGALYLRRAESSTPLPRLTAVTDALTHTRLTPRMQATAEVRRQLPNGSTADLLCDSRIGVRKMDAAETAAWQDWPGQRCSVRQLMGDGLMAAAAWQCLMAVESVRRGKSTASMVSVVGPNQQSIGACFTSPTSSSP